ncbi:TIGR04282 family arsenosugar biosynthesis glycosyltransferase [Micromonospora sp. NPDC004704]
MTPPHPVLLVLAKAPVAGAVKTRLTPPASPAQAAEIAACALLDTLDAVAATPAVTPVIALAGDLSRATRGGQIRQALAGWTVLDQHGTTFADRLCNAHLDVAARFPGQPVLQIGMDTPHLHWTLLDAAARRLDGGAQALLGAALDGGWWALGLHDPVDARALRTVPTSRPDTGARTRRALGEWGLLVDALPSMSDVDTMADAVTVAATVPGGRFAAAVFDLRDSWLVPVREQR